MKEVMHVHHVGGCCQTRESADARVGLLHVKQPDDDLTHGGHVYTTRPGRPQAELLADQGLAYWNGIRP